MGVESSLSLDMSPPQNLNPPPEWNPPQYTRDPPPAPTGSLCQVKHPYEGQSTCRYCTKWCPLRRDAAQRSHHDHSKLPLLRLHSVVVYNAALKGAPGRVCSRGYGDITPSSEQGGRAPRGPSASSILAGTGARGPHDLMLNEVFGAHVRTRLRTNNQPTHAPRLSPSASVGAIFGPGAVAAATTTRSSSVSARGTPPALPLCPSVFYPEVDEANKGAFERAVEFCALRSGRQAVFVTGPTGASPSWTTGNGAI
ncbi:hypothetical protein MAPG_09675 [Magnaporthiopsis poae ATCC 64411]|uniref:Uncharacterized protein n=1 Tax=Magnaporthiopsis poae (strain ATCC 64411 / 73-15) TaxID=644358 RepID=A0A0C4EAK0_MAGP6|nr:hypothetical protein MAPG_09675 [Magnaporthiopsis poae ATCC 64411]